MRLCCRNLGSFQVLLPDDSVQYSTAAVTFRGIWTLVRISDSLSWGWRLKNPSVVGMMKQTSSGSVKGWQLKAVDRRLARSQVHHPLSAP